MPSKLISYLSFLLKSTNQHGVHSPFIYNYVTKCLYTKPKQSKIKSVDVLLKSIAYFAARTIQIDGNPDLKQKVQEHFPEIDWDSSHPDIFFVGGLSKNKFLDFLSEGKFHNDSIIFINAIHQDANKLQQWEELITLPQITVSVDMFHLGMISIRKEQEKEHFIIRI